MYLIERRFDVDPDIAGVPAVAQDMRAFQQCPRLEVFDAKRTVRVDRNLQPSVIERSVAADDRFVRKIRLPERILLRIRILAPLHPQGLVAQSRNILYEEIGGKRPHENRLGPIFRIHGP